jgi:hypothetical protein
VILSLQIETINEANVFFTDHLRPMNVENRPLVTGEPLEFEKYAVGVQGFRKITDCFRESSEYTLK